jgi:pimeloyl-ACP methyl ester carboxylesterase
MHFTISGSIKNWSSNQMTILFLHGWHSVPGGVKPTYLNDHGHEVINPALDDDDFDAALRTAQAEFDKHQPEVVVGSSRGGALAMNIDSGNAKLILLCPAWKNWGVAKTVRPDTVILHSRADDVIPFADSEELAKNSGANLIEIGNDHRLADPESLEVLLACVESCLSRLEDTDDLLQQDWTGDCYGAAMAWITAAEEDDWVVVHGTVLSERVGKRIEHAWCERDRFVVDLAMPVGSRIIEREQYYRVLQPQVKNRYSSDDAVVLSLKNRHHGPWGEDDQSAES